MRRSSTVVAAIVLCAGGCTANTTGAPAVDTRHNAGDVAFVEALIPHHRAGIALAELVAKQPQHRVLAQAIISTERDEITRMTGWLATWGVTAPPAPTPKPPTGDPVRALAAHQEQAVTIAQREQGQGSNQTALDFAQQVIESRTAEVSELQLRPAAAAGRHSTGPRSSWEGSGARRFYGGGSGQESGG